MNIFDKLAGKTGSPFVIPGTSPGTMGNRAPAPAAPTAQANPFDQFDTPAPQAAPQAQPQQPAQPDLSQHEQAALNPFDQFDTPAQQSVQQPQVQTQDQPQTQMDGTPMRYRAGQAADPISVPTDGTKSVPTPERWAKAVHLAHMLADHRVPEAAIVQYAQDSGLGMGAIPLPHGGQAPGGLLAQLQFRRQNPRYSDVQGWIDSMSDYGHDEVPMTAAEKVYNEIGTSAPGVYVVNTGLAAGDLGNGLTGGALEHAFGDPETNRAKVAAINAQHPTAAALGTITGSIAGGAAADKAVADVAGLASKPLARAGVRVLGDAASGAAQGAGAAPDGQRTEGALVGGIVAPVAGVVSRTVAHGLGGVGSGNAQDRDVLDAADRLNAGAVAGEEIRPLPGHVSGGGVVSMGHALLEPSFMGGRASGLAKASQRFEQNAGAALGRIADDAAGGSAQDLTSVAAQANDASRPGSLAAYAGDSKQVTDSIYGQAEHLAGNTALATPRTINAIDALLAKSAATPGGIPGFEKLAALREELANGRFTVEGLRTLRTTFGDSLDSTQRAAREAAKTIWPTLSQDIRAGLVQSGKSDAAKAYRLADAKYADRAANIEVISRIIGPNADLSADQVANRIGAMSKVEYGKLGQAMSAIDPDQAAAIRGGLIDNLGAPTAGNTDAGFNLVSFGTRWAKLSDQAKAALYPPQTIRDLNDLATLATAQKGIRRLGNASRSGVTVQNLAESGAIFSGNWHALIAPFITGKILSMPGAAKAMVALAQNKPIQVVTRRLAEVARRNPAAGPAIQGLIAQLNGDSSAGDTGPLPPPDPSIATTPAPMDTNTYDPLAYDPSTFDPNAQYDPNNPTPVIQ